MEITSRQANEAVEYIEQIADSLPGDRKRLISIIAHLDGQTGRKARNAYRIVSQWICSGCRYLDEVA